MKQPLKSALIGGVTLVAVAGTVLIPAAAFAVANTSNTTVQAVIAPVISISSSPTVSINITPTASGSASSISDTVLVTTNRSNGYTLNLKDADATLTLGAVIAAHTGTVAVPTALTTVNTWGFRVDDATAYTGFTAGPTTADTNLAALVNLKWAGITSGGANIKTTATPGANNSTTVWYGAKVDTSVTDGTYSDVVTYTATTN